MRLQVQTWPCMGLNNHIDASRVASHRIVVDRLLCRRRNSLFITSTLLNRNFMTVTEENIQNCTEIKLKVMWFRSYSNFNDQATHRTIASYPYPYCPSITARCVVPRTLTSATLNPLIEKVSLDRNIMKNYRPISSVSFISQILAKVLSINDLMEHMQSAYKKHHSTETTLLVVQNDLLMAID